MFTILYYISAHYTNLNARIMRYVAGCRRTWLLRWRGVSVAGCARGMRACWRPRSCRLTPFVGPGRLPRRTAGFQLAGRSLIVTRYAHRLLDP